MVDSDFPAKPQNQQGESLSELSQDRRLLLVFLRHAGCSFCRQTLDDLGKIKDQLEEAQVNLAVVHMSPPENMEPLLEYYGLTGISQFSDPEKILFQHFGLERGSFNQLLGPKVFWLGFKACILERYGTGRPEGDMFQMPGLFLLENGQVVKEFRHPTAGDRPDYLEFLDLQQT